MSYLTIRHLHIACALLSIGLFALRGGLALACIDWRRWPPLRWLPHLNDSLLLAAAVSLAWLSGQYPFQQAWLTAKVIALAAYVLLGKRALAPQLPVSRRLAWLAAALACVGYIVAVAVTRSPLPFL
ncbi:SirB2 family protein [Chitinimonas koreensis]|uniref:SirB2 family protein n=1 Tax=Chitinimonas koreensis TaxID=356302 RepID=UPI00040075DD|nr:SirB2 family protein [Chitinimonas koreensis]QNM95146.1 SirB2 family protein [Chitinimonas koreensis]